MSAFDTASDDSQQVLLDTYTELLTRAAQMQVLASSEQWAELIEERTHYVMLVDKLRELDERITLDDTGKARKAELLERILEHDVEIRRRLVTRRDELGKLIGVSQKQRDLHRAYAPQQGGSYQDEPSP
ncbi:flagellar protein FliT [Halomonas sp. GD1P12]|uniref:flagellar protein FliT n=1 Tax=Halomonas sp. GD1P12 TaxID=2982691 RepID=UPI0021E3F224|nr:flagellar protein FliT [Halomonas sp. GD1P12]UYG00068.1 flagellar protein FliT [Halomonas sp. GD1P12]